MESSDDNADTVGKLVFVVLVFGIEAAVSSAVTGQLYRYRLSSYSLSAIVSDQHLLRCRMYRSSHQAHIPKTSTFSITVTLMTESQLSVKCQPTELLFDSDPDRLLEPVGN